MAERLSGRADEIEKALQGLADSVRDELSAVKADLEELRAVKEGIGARAEEAAAPAAEPVAAGSGGSQGGARRRGGRSRGGRSREGRA